MRIVGYEKLIDLLKAAYALRMLGVPAHVLLIGPPGTAKTTTAKLFARAVGARFVRTTGRHDMLPEDFIAEKTIDTENGRLTTRWELRAVKHLVADGNTRPAIWFFDEFDKLNRKSMTALLELMEEQQVTLPTGETIRLNFMLIAAGNSRKYDRDANPIPRSVRDRFLAYYEVQYLPPDLERQVLSTGIRYYLGVDTEPSDQFRFDVDLSAVRRAIEIAENVYGDCVVRAIAEMRGDKNVAEPPGPRAGIHAIILAGALAVVRGNYAPTYLDALDAFVSAVSGKISVTKGSAEELCQYYFEKYCRECAERFELEQQRRSKFRAGHASGRSTGAATPRSRSSVSLLRWSEAPGYGDT